MRVPKPGLGMLKACATGFGLWLLMPARETFYHQWKTFPTISALAEWDLFICAMCRRQQQGHHSSVTQGTSACWYPAEKDLWAIMSGQADVTARQKDAHPGREV